MAYSDVIPAWLLLPQSEKEKPMTDFDPTVVLTLEQLAALTPEQLELYNVTHPPVTFVDADDVGHDVNRS